MTGDAASGASAVSEAAGTSQRPARGKPPVAVAAIVPAYQEAARITATIEALKGLPAVRHVVVVDDGSSDDTALHAERAGALVERSARNRGKGAAMERGAARVRRLPDAADLALLFADADLGASAANLGVLIDPVLAGEADLTIANLPPQDTSGGGHGFVVRLARNGIHRLTGWEANQPLSGMRCLTTEAFDAARPLAVGWGVETGMTIDVLLGGFTVVEVPCALQHRVSGRDLAGQLHRAGQYRDVARALATRRMRRAAPLRVLARLPKPPIPRLPGTGSGSGSGAASGSS